MNRCYNSLRLVLNDAFSNQSYKIVLKSNYKTVSISLSSKITSNMKYCFSQRKWTPKLIDDLSIYIYENHKIEMKKEKWDVLIQYYYDNIKQMKKMKKKNKIDMTNNDGYVMLLLDYFVDNKLLDINANNKLYLDDFKLDLLLNVIDIYYSMNNTGIRKILQVITNFIRNDVSISIDIIEYIHNLFGSKYQNDIIELINLWVVQCHKNIVKIINLENIDNENFAKLIIDQLLLYEYNNDSSRISTLLIFVSPLRKSVSRVYFHTNLMLYFYQKFNIKAIDYINDNQFGRYFKEWNNMNLYVNNSKFSSYIIRLLNYSKVESMDKMYQTPLVIEVKSNEIKSYINNRKRIKSNGINSNDCRNYNSTLTLKNVLKFSLNDVKELVDVEKMLTFSSSVRQQLSKPSKISKFTSSQSRPNNQTEEDQEINYHQDALEDIKLINDELNTINNINEQIPYI